MPVINLDYDDAVVSKEDVRSLSDVLQKIVADVTNIDDVNVYTNTAQIKVNVLPLEVFIRMSASKVTDETAIVEGIKSRLAQWKTENAFQHKINIYLIPMHWTVATDI